VKFKLGKIIKKVKVKRYLNTLAFWKKKYYCPICGRKRIFLPFGIFLRQNASCAACGALERHRFAYHVYQNEFLSTQSPVKILHIAPEKSLSRAIMNNTNIQYYPIDLNPKGYNFVNCQKEDVTNLSFEDNYFDFILCNHVMEHIVDEKKFLSETMRVLKNGAKFILTIPIYHELKESFENPDIKTEKDRLKFYGQEDHVRKYGMDIIKKLETTYNARHLLPAEILSPSEIESEYVESTYGSFLNDIFLITK